MDNPPTISPELASLRAEIDTTDAAILDFLARRFELTKKVGEIKRTANMPPTDPQREAAQEARIRALAEQRGVNPEVAWSIFRTIIDEVVQNHTELQSSKPSAQ